MAVNRSSFITVHQEAIVFTAQISDIRAHCQVQFIHHENNDVFAHLFLSQLWGTKSTKITALSTKIQKF